VESNVAETVWFVVQSLKRFTHYRDDAGFSSLHMAALFGVNFDFVAATLLEAKADIDAKCNKGRRRKCSSSLLLQLKLSIVFTSALHIAALQDNATAVDFLLARRADAKAVDRVEKAMPSVPAIFSCAAERIQCAAHGCVL